MADARGAARGRGGIGMRRYGAPVDLRRTYRDRPGAYGVIREGGDLLVTEQAAPQAGVPAAGRRNRPGGRGDRALHRECLEETGWRIQALRRLGAFQRFAFMPEYDIWARKVCHVYLARAVLRVGAPAEPGHRALGCRSRPRSSASRSTATGLPGEVWRGRACSRRAPAARRRVRVQRLEERAAVRRRKGRPPPVAGTDPLRAGRPLGRASPAGRRCSRGEGGPVRPSARAPTLDAARRQRHVAGHADVPRADPLGDPLVGGVRPLPAPPRSSPGDARLGRSPPFATKITRRACRSATRTLVLDRAGVRVDVDHGR